jgi:uncharacterized protein (UPF0332 family)
MIEKDKSEMVSYRIRRAKETLQEVQLHIDNELWATAINRLYYACFYAVSALLLNHNMKSQTHAGTRQMFGLHFVKTGIISKELGKFYSDIFEMRQTGDYDDFVDFTKDDVLGAYIPAKDLIKSIELLLK